MRAVVIIPARFKSTRFPGKPLVPLLGKPMVVWVAELSAVAVGRDNVYVATDDKQIAESVAAAGFNFIMTSSNCLTGTDRLAEAATKIDADIYINVQGDEPLVDPVDILKAYQLKVANMDCVVNSYCQLQPHEDPGSVNIPKVVVSENNYLIYMSRSLVPGFKDVDCSRGIFYKQVCIYAFTKEELHMFQSFGRKSLVESSEDIEILRFFELGKKILMFEACGGSLAVDVPSDVSVVEAALSRVNAK